MISSMQGIGVGSLPGPDPATNSPAATNSDLPWRLLAQSAIHDTNAANDLILRALHGQIPADAWEAIAQTLMSEELQNGHLVEVSQSEASNWSEQERTDRMDLVKDLLGATSDAAAQRAFQKVLASLEDSQSPNPERKKDHA